MNKINHAFFAKEAVIITALCLMVAGICKLIGLSNSILLTIFTMAVMTSAAIYPVQGKSLRRIFASSIVVSASIIAGGLLGKFDFLWGEILSLLMTGGAFYFPKTREDSALWVTASLMFVIFLFFPASIHDSVIYGAGGIGVAGVFTAAYSFLNRFFSKDLLDPSPKARQEEISHRKTRGLIAMSSILLGFIAIDWLGEYTHFDHLSWIVLTIMMVIQGPTGKTLLTCLKRTLINALGAVIGIALFTYILPLNFWVNFGLLTVLLFSIFCFGYSYFWRVLFIELFVLALAYVMGSFVPFTALDRILLTTVGAGIVVGVTMMGYLILLLKQQPKGK